MDQWPGISSRVSVMTPNMLLECVWERSKLAHVQLALACQQSMICAQHRLRLPIQHVYGHIGNLGNECADHAAALGTFGLTSSHNVTTRWIRNTFDASVCFDGCNNISEVLERLQHIRTDATSPPQNWSYCCIYHRVHCVSCASHAHFCVIGDPALSFLLSHVYFVLQKKQWKALLRLSLPCRALVILSRITCGFPFRNCLSRADKRRNFSLRRRNRIGPNCALLSLCFLIYSATRKVFTVLYDATLGTIARGDYVFVQLLWCVTQNQMERIQRVVALKHYCARRSS